MAVSGIGMVDVRLPDHNRPFDRHIPHLVTSGGGPFAPEFGMSINVIAKIAAARSIPGALPLLKGSIHGTVAIFGNALVDLLLERTALFTELLKLAGLLGSQGIERPSFQLLDLLLYLLYLIIPRSPALCTVVGHWWARG